MKKRLIALVLCICMVGSMTVNAVDENSESSFKEVTVTTEPIATVTVEETEPVEEDPAAPKANVGDVTISLGGVPDDVSLVAKDQTEAALDTYSDSLTEHIAYDQEVVFAYDITPVANGAEWQPVDGESVTVFLNGFDDVENGQYMTILHIDDDGNVEPLANGGVIVDGKLVFETSGFSMFIGVYDWEGSGQKDDPFLIRTVRDLEYMAYCTANGQSLENCYFLLMNDIDLSSNYGPSIEGSKVNWIPIGGHKVDNDDTPAEFKGVFSGNYPGYTISGLYIDNETANNAGLFGIVGEGGVVRNLSVKGSIKGNNCVAGVVGAAYNATIANCTNEAEITGKQYVGGIAGNVLNSTISNCKNAGNITASYQSVGGIVGWSQTDPSKTGVSIIKDCENRADIRSTDIGTLGIQMISHVGGIVGSAIMIEISACKNTGNATGGGHVGGIVGVSNACTVKDCINGETGINSLIKTENGYGAGGIVGVSTGTSKISYCTNYGAVETNIFGMAGGIVGWCEDYATGNKDYGKESTVNVSQISYCANAGAITGKGHHVQSWVDEVFAAGISGYGGTISNCYNTGAIKADAAHGPNCPIISRNVDNYAYELDCNAGRYVAGIVSADANVINCWNSGSISGRDSVGGIIAVNNPRYYSVINCYNLGELTFDSAEAEEGRKSAGIMCLSHLVDGWDASKRNFVENCYHGGSAYESIIQFNLGWITVNSIYAKSGSYSSNTAEAVICDDLSTIVTTLNDYVNNKQKVTVQNGDEIVLESWVIGQNGYPVFTFNAGAFTANSIGTYTITYHLNDSEYGLDENTFSTAGVAVEALSSDTQNKNLHRVNTNQSTSQQTDSIVINGTQYTFRSWNTKADGTGIDYLAGAPLPTFSSNTILYAQWDVGWVLRYKFAEGVNPDLRYQNNMMPVDSQYYKTDDIATVIDFANPWKNDFLMGDFGYWTEKEDGTGTRYYPGDTVKMDRNKTLYAVVTFDLTIKTDVDLADENQMFLYTIEQVSGLGGFSKMTVAVAPGGKTTVIDVPAGEYKITQLNDWSWRYDDDQIVSSAVDGNTADGYNSFTVKKDGSTNKVYTNATGNVIITFGSPNDATANVTFKNYRTEICWLSSEYFIRNLFNQAITAPYSPVSPIN